MGTRTKLFDTFSNKDGYSFHLGHNKPAFSTAFSYLEYLTPLPTGVEKGDIFGIPEPSGNGTLSITQLPFKPSELFPDTYFNDNLKYFMVVFPGTNAIYINADSHISTILLKYKSWNDLKHLIMGQKLKYEIIRGENGKVLGTEFLKIKDNNMPIKIRPVKTKPATTASIEQLHAELEAAGASYSNAVDFDKSLIIWIKRDDDDDSDDKLVKKRLKWNKGSTPKNEMPAVLKIIQMMLTFVDEKDPVETWKELLQINLLEPDKDYTKRIFSMALNIYVSNQTRFEWKYRIKYIDLSGTDKLVL
jgi:hypothetical protein